MMGADDFHVSADYDVVKIRTEDGITQWCGEEQVTVKSKEKNTEGRDVIPAKSGGGWQGIAWKLEQELKETQAKLAALTRVHEQFADNGVDESFSLMQRLKQTEVRAIQAEASIKELVEALEESLEELEGYRSINCTCEEEIQEGYKCTVCYVCDNDRHLVSKYKEES